MQLALVSTWVAVEPSAAQPVMSLCPTPLRSRLAPMPSTSCMAITPTAFTPNQSVVAVALAAKPLVAASLCQKEPMPMSASALAALVVPVQPVVMSP